MQKMSRSAIPRMLTRASILLVVTLLTFQLQMMMMLPRTIESVSALGGNNIFGFFRKRRQKYFSQQQQHPTETNVVVANTMLATTTRTTITTTTTAVAEGDTVTPPRVDGMADIKLVASTTKRDLGVNPNQALNVAVGLQPLILIHNNPHLPQKTTGWTTSAWYKK